MIATEQNHSNTPTHEQLTSRDRWLKSLQMQPVDRLAFWPKIDNSYARHQQGQWAGMTVEQLHQWIGSDQHHWLNSCLQSHFDGGSVQWISDEQTSTTIYRAGSWEGRCVIQNDPVSGSGHPIEHPIKTVDDIQPMIDCIDAETFTWNQQQAEQVADFCQNTDTGLTVTQLGQTGLMNCIEWLVGVENAHYLIFDEPEKMQQLFNAIQRRLLRRAKLVGQYHPADAVYLIENTSTTLISVEQYQQLDLQHVQQIARTLTEHIKDLILHMCGHLKAILPDLATTGARAFEAFTAPPLGSATLAEGRDACPDTCLIGGTHAMIWLEPEDKIIQFIDERLQELDHHRGIVLTSAGVMPPACPPDRIKAVCNWIKQYNARW